LVGQNECGFTRAFSAIGETPDGGDDAILYDQLIQNTDRLGELIAATNAPWTGSGSDKKGIAD
jgi:hypothetical protein